MTDGLCAFRNDPTRCGGPVETREYRADGPDLPPAIATSVAAIRASVEAKGGTMSATARVRIVVCEQHAALFEDPATVVANAHATEVPYSGDWDNNTDGD